MRQLSILFIVIISFIFVHGCGYKEGVVEPDRQSYMRFTGNTSGAVVIVDDNVPFTLGEPDNAEGKAGTQKAGKGRMLYSIKPGKHEVVIKKDGSIVVHRVLLVDKGVTKEVHVP